MIYETIVLFLLTVPILRLLGVPIRNDQAATNLEGNWAYDMKSVCTYEQVTLCGYVVHIILD